MALLARGVNWLFRHHYAMAFHGILGIVVASTLVILPLSYTGVGEMLLSALFALAGAALAYFLDRLDRRSREN
jgi:putative membrane protein